MFEKGTPALKMLQFAKSQKHANFQNVPPILYQIY